MDNIRAMFKGYPSQEKVAMMMLRHGLRVEGDSAYCGDIEQSDVAMSRAAGVDRRVVRATIERIEGDAELRRVFSKLRSMLLMADMAPEIGCTTLEIIPTDATLPGILAAVTEAIYRRGLTVRQAVVDDPGNRMDSHLIVVVDGKVPAEILPAIRECKGVASVILR
ncbi:MAG: regulator of amino acid metabolism, contains ACT domain protein [Candidatus Methanoplasma sp.]|jgi:predicted regulator of amino acid metabolism with ACT domain|nr:regulator of amino acid metabolism, contains ACT domain protein [Candidatus Methanoplasma sp.]